MSTRDIVPLGKTSKLSLAFLITANFGTFFVQTYLVFYLTSKGLSAIELSALFSSSFATVILLNFLTGNLADKYGRMRIFLAGLVFSTLGYLLFAFGLQFIHFLLGEICFGVSIALGSGAFEAWYVDKMKTENTESEIDSFFPIHQGLTNLTGIVAGALATVLIAISLNLPMLIAAVITAAAALLGLTFRDNYGEKGRTLRTIVRISLQYFAKSSALRYFTIAEVARGGSLIAYTFTYQPYLVAHGLSANYLGILFSGLLAASAVGSFGTIELMKRLDKRYMLVISSSTLVAAFALLTISDGLILPIVGFALCGLASGIAYASIALWRNDLIPSGTRAALIALLNTVSNASTISVYLLLGLAISALGYGAGFVIGFLLAAASVPLYLLAKMSQSAEG